MHSSTARDMAAQLAPKVTLDDCQSNEDCVKEWANCKEAHIDNDGGIWIADPQSGHWLSDDETISFIDWCIHRYPGRFTE